MALLLCSRLGVDGRSSSEIIPIGIVAGPDGNLWFAENVGNKVGRTTVNGAIAEFPVPTTNSFPYEIATGSDGALWFTETYGNRIGRITTGVTPSVAVLVPTMSSSMLVVLAAMCAGIGLRLTKRRARG